MFRGPWSATEFGFPRISGNTKNWFGARWLGDLDQTFGHQLGVLGRAAEIHPWSKSGGLAIVAAQPTPRVCLIGLGRTP